MTKLLLYRGQLERSPIDMCRRKQPWSLCHKHARVLCSSARHHFHANLTEEHNELVNDIVFICLLPLFFFVSCMIFADLTQHTPFLFLLCSAHLLATLTSERIVILFAFLICAEVFLFPLLCSQILLTSYLCIPRCLDKSAVCRCCCAPQMTTYLTEGRKKKQW